MEDLLTSIHEANNAKNRNNKQFVSIADHIRNLVTPKSSYPGLLSELDPQTIDQVIDLLSYFRTLVLKNINIFQSKHVSRAIDSMNIIALAYAIKFQRSGDKFNLENSKREFQEAINTCQQTGLTNDIQFSVSAIYNVASFLMKFKAYEYSIELFRIVSNLSKKNELVAKSNKLTCQCLIALNNTNNPDFVNLLCNSSNQISIICTLLQVNPPSNPTVITQLLSNISKRCNNPNIMNEIGQILPFYALHGDLEMLNHYDDYKDFFPNLQPPKMSFFNNQNLDNCFFNCHQFFENQMFFKCATQSVHLLENIPNNKLTPHVMLALFFVHYWIIFSYDAIGKPDAGIFYSKRMLKLFKSYPFIGGFSVFLELKCKIHAQRLDKLHQLPKMQFESPFNWESVHVFYRAICEYLCSDCKCIDSFDEVFCDDDDPDFNIFVQREAFNYFVKALKDFECEVCLNEFQQICSTSNETKALFLYHKVIENVKNFDFNEIWSYKENKNVNFKAVYMNLKMLDEAEKHAHGFVTITRKIKQLKALLSGTCDMEKTAILLSSSLSSYIDKQLPSCSGPMQLKFPILATVYLHIQEIEPCLLFAYFCPRCKPFVVRICTGNSVDNFLSKLDQIQTESMRIPTDISRREWWTRKINLDKQLEGLINDFETNVLGFWRCLLSPISPNQQQSPIAACLSVFLQNVPQKNVQQVMNQIERSTGFTFPRKSSIQSTQGQKLTLQLLLGRFIHQIPWESMPFVTKNNIAITRIPSMKVVAVQSGKNIPFHIDPRSAFFILNPQRNLEESEKRLVPVFKNLKWNGFVKNSPNKDEMLNKLQNTDLFVYCGHGSGREFFDYDSLISQKKQCRSTMMLMGCSSGKLTDDGEINPIGVPYYCVAAGSSSVIANLWNVTDGEIDRFTQSLLEKMKKNGQKDEEFVLENEVLQCRNACKLKYLTGAAPVVYGFPTLVHKII